MISINGIRKEYDNRCVLDISKLKFVPAKRYALMGANGSGKSTLLKIIAGVLQSDEGSVATDGESIGYLPQKPYAFGFTVLRNVCLAMQDRDHETAMALLRAVGIDSLAQQRGHKLSGGETQRLALARVLALPHSVLLLDEPTAAADISGTDMIEKAIFDYHQKTDCTVISTTHTPAQALRIADEVLFMDAGRIIERGDAKQMLTEPRTDEFLSFLQHWSV